MRFTGNRYIAVTVKELDASRAFYEGVMGFTPKKVEEKIVVYDTGSLTLYVQELEYHPPVPSFNVDNLSEAKDLLEANGCTVTQERKRSLYFKNPDGNVWDIIEG